MKINSSVRICVVCLSTVIAFSSCSPKNKSGVRTGIDPAPQAQASPEVGQSFAVQTRGAYTSSDTTSADNTASSDNTNQTSAEGIGVDHAHVLIKKSALDKEFLLSTNLLSETPTPSFSSLQSRVVSFVKRDQNVYMLDVTKTHVVGQDNIPQTLLIAELPILKENADSLEIDFNAGMKQIFTTGDMASSDDKDNNGDYKLSTSQIGISYLDEVSLRDNALFIRQIAQVQKSSSGVEPVEVRYQIKPYIPDPDFVPVISPGLSKVGYFEASPITLQDGSSISYAMKWNEKKTIHFAISANTPAKYRDLVKSALLYWNKILGDQALDVVQLEDKSITAPRFDMNIIQWVDWDSAGFAFADAHVDPRSGEVTSAQIFMPSAFTLANVAKRIRLTDSSLAHPRAIPFGLRGFRSARLCERNMAADLAARELSVPVSDEAMDKAMRDYVYEVIAHELGHVLGLRHNFAGSLAANYDFKDRKNLIMSYYRNQKAPEGIVASSSVMEYSRFEESSWNGDRFRRGEPALSYDQMAMEFLYKKKPLPTENRPLFCTDSQIATYVDCNMSDAGRSIISGASGAYSYGLESLAARIINTYVTMSKAPDDQGTPAIPVSRVSLNAASVVTTIGSDLGKLMSVFKDGSKFIAVRSPLFPILATASDDVLKAEKDYVDAEVQRLGGIEALTQALPDNFADVLVAKVRDLLQDPMYNSGVSQQGVSYAFSDDEKAVILQQVQLFAPQLKERLILNEIKALSGGNYDLSASYGQNMPDDDTKWADNDTTYALANILEARFEKYSLSKTDQKVSGNITKKNGIEVKLDLPVYAYSQPIRVAAAKLLSSGHKAIDWGVVAKAKASDAMDKEGDVLKPAFGDDGPPDDMSSLSRPVIQWILNNHSVSSALGD